MSNHFVSSEHIITLIFTQRSAQDLKGTRFFFFFFFSFITLLLSFLWLGREHFLLMEFGAARVSDPALLDHAGN
jgi:hypothetical protein